MGTKHQQYLQLSLSKVKTLTRAIEYETNNPGLVAAVAMFGAIRPIYINRNGFTVLNPLDLDAIAAQPSPPDSIPCVIVDIDPTLDTALSIILNGGLDGWLNGVPKNDAAVWATIAHLTQLNQLDILGAPADYYSDLFSLSSPPVPATNSPQNLLHAPKPKPALNDFDIPALDANLQITTPPGEWALWGSQARSIGAEAYIFYTDDSKFNGLLSEPGKLAAAGAKCAVEINPTTSDHHPAALVIADLWRKRKLSQVWQEAGIRVAVDLNISRRFFDVALLGVPVGWRAYANRAYTEDTKHLHDAYTLAQRHAQTDDILYFVYGRNSACELCEANRWIYIPADQQRG